MTKAEAKTRVEKLKQEINRYRYAYHVEGKSLISANSSASLAIEQMARATSSRPAF